MILTRNESNLEQHKKICILQKKKKQKENRRKTNRKQAILTENSQRINKNYR